MVDYTPPLEQVQFEVNRKFEILNSMRKEYEEIKKSKQLIEDTVISLCITFKRLKEDEEIESKNWTKEIKKVKQKELLTVQNEIEKMAKRHNLLHENLKYLEDRLFHFEARKAELEKKAREEDKNRIRKAYENYIRQKTEAFLKQMKENPHLKEYERRSRKSPLVIKKRGSHSISEDNH